MERKAEEKPEWRKEGTWKSGRTNWERRRKSDDGIVEVEER